MTEGNLHYLREKYAIDFITLYELEIGLDSVLAGGPVNVPQREAHALRGCRLCLGVTDRNADRVSADPYDAVQDARSDRGEWNEGDVADDAAEAFRWGFAADGHELEDSGREQ